MAMKRVGAGVWEAPPKARLRTLAIPKRRTLIAMQLIFRQYRVRPYHFGMSMDVWWFHMKELQWNWAFSDAG